MSESDAPSHDHSGPTRREKAAEKAGRAKDAAESAVGTTKQVAASVKAPQTVPQKVRALLRYLYGSEEHLSIRIAMIVLGFLATVLVAGFALFIVPRVQATADSGPILATLFKAATNLYIWAGFMVLAAVGIWRSQYRLMARKTASLSRFSYHTVLHLGREARSTDGCDVLRGDSDNTRPELSAMLLRSFDSQTENDLTEEVPEDYAAAGTFLGWDTDDWAPALPEAAPATDSDDTDGDDDGPDTPETSDGPAEAVEDVTDVDLDTPLEELTFAELQRRAEALQDHIDESLDDFLSSGMDLGAALESDADRFSMVDLADDDGQAAFEDIEAAEAAFEATVEEMERRAEEDTPSDAAEVDEDVMAVFADSEDTDVDDGADSEDTDDDMNIVERVFARFTGGRDADDPGDDDTTTTTDDSAAEPGTEEERPSRWKQGRSFGDIFADWWTRTYAGFNATEFALRAVLPGLATLMLAFIALQRAVWQPWVYLMLFATAAFIGTLSYTTHKVRKQRRLQSSRTRGQREVRRTRSALAKATDTQGPTGYYVWMSGRRYFDFNPYRLADKVADRWYRHLQHQEVPPSIQQKYARDVAQMDPLIHTVENDNTDGRAAMADDLARVVWTAESPPEIVPKHELGRRASQLGDGIGHDPDLLAEVYEDLYSCLFKERDISLYDSEGEEVTVTMVARRDRHITPQLAQLRSQYSERILPPVDQGVDADAFALPDVEDGIPATDVDNPASRPSATAD